MKKIYSYFVMSLFSVLLLSASPSTGLLFSGSTSSIIDLGPQAAFSPSQFTLEVWANYQVLNGGGYIISTEGWNPTNHGFSLRLSGNKLQFSFGDGSAWQGITSSTDIVPQTWFHAAVTYSGTQVTMYINGVQTATAAVTTPMVASPEKVIFGDSPTWTNRCFNGILSDFRFWNVVRSQAEITSDMTSTLTGSETGLVAGWKMNEGTGTIVADIKATYPITLSSNVMWYPATSIAVSGNAIITDGGTTQMSAVLNGNATAAQNFTWTVSDPGIATINPYGFLSARKNGEVTVTATAKDGSNVAGSTQIMVSNQIVPVKQVFIDFGLSTGTTPAATADTYGNYWNNAIDFATTAAAVALVDNSKASTGFNLHVTTAFAGNNGPTAGGLTTPNASFLGEFAITTATQDYFHANPAGLKITGLNPNKGYRFKFFGSRDNTETRKSQFVLTGSNSITTPELQTSGTNVGGIGINGNNSNILRSELVYPTAAGEITIAVNKTAGTFAHLNIMKIEEFDKVLVSGIAVTGNAISTVGGTTQMTATILPANATFKDVVWTVNNPIIATVSSTGLLTANNNGTVTVTATSKDGSNISGTVQIVVSGQPVPTKQIYLDFEPSAAGTSTFPTTNPDVNGNYWNSVTNNTVASGSLALKDNTGAASGLSIHTLVDFLVNPSNGVMGLATPSASLLGEFAIPTATQDFFFMDNATSRSLKITGLNTNKGYKFYAYGCRVATDTRISKYTFIGATTVSGTQQTSGANLGGTGINGNNSTVFSTPIMTADANGEVKFELGYVTGMAYINIMKIEETNINVTSININGATISTNAGTSQMTATILPANATEKGINWSVDDESIATINDNGLLTAKTNGTVKVTATSKEAGSSVSNTIEVVVSGQATTGFNNSSVGVKVFPVVSDNQILVKGATTIVELFNSTGIKVAVKEASSQTVINTANLPKGIYVLVVDKKQSYKLVK